MTIVRTIPWFYTTNTKAPPVGNMLLTFLNLQSLRLFHVLSDCLLTESKKYSNLPHTCCVGLNSVLLAYQQWINIVFAGCYGVISILLLSWFLNAEATCDQASDCFFLCCWIFVKFLNFVYGPAATDSRTCIANYFHGRDIQCWLRPMPI